LSFGIHHQLSIFTRRQFRPEVTRTISTAEPSTLGTIMRAPLIILFIIVQNTMTTFAQVNQNRAWQEVLTQDQIGKEYSYDNSKKYFFNNKSQHQYDSLVLIYLGQITTKNGRLLKFLTSRWFWGTSPGATSRIVVFNSKNQYLGNYYLTMTYDIPDKIERSFLIFQND
jgi:hypothetical protein